MLFKQFFLCQIYDYKNRNFRKLRLSQHCLFVNITHVFYLPVIKTSCKKNFIFNHI
jgi:hypothetical protein